jgi:glycosyltransferase involved in cell wall biosynthesis
VRAGNEEGNDDAEPDNRRGSRLDRGGHRPNDRPNDRPLTVGIVATRLQGTDGVSLETAKVARVLTEAGHRVVYFAGVLSEQFQPGHVVPDAHFQTELNRSLEHHCFDTAEPLPSEIRCELEEQATLLEHALYGFIEEHGVDVVMAQNCSSIPMQFPLGLALASVLEGTGLPAIGHHHDFSWERERFRRRPVEVEGFLDYAFPPTHLPNMRHLVIHGLARAQLERRSGVASTILPNVMDFEHRPEPGDAGRFRRALGVDDERRILLQPTRVVPRKRIEATIDLASELARVGGPPVTVVVTHEEGDEGSAYGDKIRALARSKGVDFRSCPVPIEYEATGSDWPTLADAYAAASLVCYPSTVEGFGNALLEAVYYRRPVLVNRYPVYVSDIAPLGLQCIEIAGGTITPATVAEARACLEHPRLWDELVDHNYAICLDHFAFKVLRERILPLVEPAARAEAVPAHQMVPVRDRIRQELATTSRRRATEPGPSFNRELGFTSG